MTDEKEEAALCVSSVSKLKSHRVIPVVEQIALHPLPGPECEALLCDETGRYERNGDPSRQTPSAQPH
jgi:hypothetical protein